MAYARPAAPPAGYIAGIREIEEAVPAVAERRRDAAAGKGNQRACAWLSRRRVGCPDSLADNPGTGGRQRPEQLQVNTGGRDADRSKGITHIGHIRRRPADVRLRAGRQLQRGECVLSDVPGDGMLTAELG